MVSVVTTSLLLGGARRIVCIVLYLGPLVLTGVRGNLPQLVLLDILFLFSRLKSRRIILLTCLDPGHRRNTLIVVVMV